MIAAETRFSREPLQIVEIEQPRCVNRFGVSPCTATGTPKCFQTWTTCKDRVNFNSVGGSLKWRFIPSRRNISAWGDYSDADNPQTDGIAGLVSVREGATQINVSGILKGKSPLGIRGSVTVVLDDVLDPVSASIGDHYKDERTIGSDATFWELWTSRNRFFAGMYLRVYDGYNGQNLSEMRQSLYVIETVNGPSNGKIIIKGIDPLRLAQEDKAQFPRVTDVYLVGDIDQTTTDITVVSDDLVNLTDAFGNTSESYIRMGDEILSYTGATATADPNTYTLDDVQRGDLGTTKGEHSDETSMQRVGHYSKFNIWEIADDLIVNHTQIPDEFVDLAAWTEEAGGYLSAFQVTGTVAEPTSVESLLGELCQQGQFSIWWDTYSQQINLIVVQPPLGDVPIMTDSSDLLLDGVSYDRNAGDLITRIVLHYKPISVVGDLDDPANFETVEIRVQTDAENKNAADAVVTREVFSRWLGTRSQALSVTKRINDVYGFIEGGDGRQDGLPATFTAVVDAKDRSAIIGSIRDITAREFKDSEGNAETRRWQVVKSEPVEAGIKYRLTFQRFPYTGRFGVYMSETGPNFDTATTLEKESGMFYADTNGEMPDGSEGYKYA